jgi:hypothetical protein
LKSRLRQWMTAWPMLYIQNHPKPWRIGDNESQHGESRRNETNIPLMTRNKRSQRSGRRILPTQSFDDIIQFCSSVYTMLIAKVHSMTIYLWTAFPSNTLVIVQWSFSRLPRYKRDKRDEDDKQHRQKTSPL